ncbi:MAG: DUF1264 domain-containing protein [Rubrivivax sp.]|nr:MAG: DUF1264 domain-containing protein [Rubrivivax sp.]
MNHRMTLVAISATLLAMAPAWGNEASAPAPSKPPIDALNTHLGGFHFANGDVKNRVEAHHYCASPSDEFAQCVIYDGNSLNAKIIGIEYIIGEKLYKDLPASEKALWHSHAEEVKSGQLTAPGIPEFAEKLLMKKLVNSYGRTWHTGVANQHRALSSGSPQLMGSAAVQGTR